jgi:Tfp pilus assembly protein PilF
MDGISTVEGAATFRSVFGRVTTAKGEPVRDAGVEVLTNGGSDEFVSLLTDPKGEFQHEYYFYRYTAKEFIALVTVSKKGYPKAHAYANFGASGNPFGISIVLRPTQSDPTLLSQADLISGLTPKLRRLDTSDGLAAKDIKTYERGVEQFLDKNRLDLAVPLFEKLVAANPACLRCRVMLALADIGWGDWPNAEHHLGESLNVVLANPKPGSADALLAYGVWMSWQHNPDKAESLLRKAVKDAPQDALALQELGRAQCMDMNWEGAEDSLKKALAAGAGPEARLLHAEALVWAGTVKDADAELDRYLDGRDIKRMPPWVQEIGQKIQDRKKDDTALVKLQKLATPYTDYVNNPPPEFQGLDPAGDQVKLDSLLTAVGKNIANLFQNFPNTVSLEKIHQEKLDRKGKSAGSLNQQFHYLCLMPSGQWGPQTDEYRADSTGNLAYPRGLSENFMLTAGFVAAPLIFHPTYQPGSMFRLLGRQKANGRDAYVIAFAQEPKRARMYGKFSSGGEARYTFYQGVAWVDPTNYQILRLRTELLAPLPAVKLQAETTEIEFSEVHFKHIAEGFWLPAEVTVTIDWEGQHLRNRHEYSDFAVFNVDAMGKIAKPKNAPPATQGESAPPETP